MVRSAHAVVVNWGSLTWPAGSLSNSFDVDPATPGNDVTVTVTGDTGGLVQALGSGDQTPAITSNLTGGFSPVHPSLQLAVNQTTNLQSVTVTIDFSNMYAAGVSNVSFNLFDIDTRNSGGNTYQDLISSIKATSTTGTSIAPTITGLGVDVTLSGSGLAQLLTGTGTAADNTSNGNATISFNTTNIRSITFTYGDTALYPTPTYQHIAIDNISFVPETNPGWVCAIGCGLLALGTARRRVSRRRLVRVR
jgi:hypothetical protein